MRNVLLGFVAATLILGTIDWATSAKQPPAATITLSAEEAAYCEAEGGCTLVTNAFLTELAQEMQRLRKIVEKNTI